MNCFKHIKIIIIGFRYDQQELLWLPNMGSNEFKEISVTWEDFRRPKYERGLEIRMNEGVNKASINKLEWRILTDNDIYHLIIREKYI